MKNTNFLKGILFALTLAFTAILNAQQGPPIAWVSGDDTWNQGPNGVPIQAGIYGQRGVEAPANLPGARSNSVSWTDMSGNFWLFGGTGYDKDGKNGRLNDLWRYNPVTKQWAWINGSDQIDQAGIYGSRGTASSSNTPGARSQSVVWADTRGNLWLFGGQGYDRNSSVPFLNDLWKYEIATNRWTWVSGNDFFNPNSVNYGTRGTASASNLPGGRTQSVGWIDASGNLWMFGGNGYDSRFSQGPLNDLWRFNTTTNQWTWVAGNNINRQAGTYGTKDIAAATNTPGGRLNASAWTDAGGNLWLFGGQGYDKSPTGTGLLNDLWKFNIATAQWTWVDGSDVRNQFGTYGAKGVADTTNAPGARTNAEFWADKNGNFWLFGGSGFHKAGSSGLSDLWKFNTATNQWTWVNGSDAGAEATNYGTKGVPSPTNTIGSRTGMANWIDGSGNLWLFGGSNRNDLWKYNVVIDQWSWESGLSSYFKGGEYGKKGVSSPLNLPGARIASQMWNDKDGNLLLFGGNGYDKNGTNGFLNDWWKFNPSDNQWTWMGGSDTAAQSGNYGSKGSISSINIPGARGYSVNWTDTKGNLWLFGGSGYDKNGRGGSLNDLWKFDVAVQQWTWIGGGDTTGQAGKYGNKGITDILNTPGARDQAVSWADPSGNLWMFGGLGYDKNGSYQYLNDLWKFDIVKNQWAWINGSDTARQPGSYGTKGVASIANVPGARYGSVSWADEKGNLWLFGGIGLSKDPVSIGRLNDLWKFNTATNQWTWVSGSDLRNDAGNQTMPSARYNSVAWYDSIGKKLWLFGGSTSIGVLNDLWTYNLIDTGWVLMKGERDQSSQPGNYGVKGKGNTSNIPGSKNGAVGTVDKNGDLWLFGGNGYDKNGTSGFLNDLWRIALCQNMAKPKFNTDQSIICSSDQNPVQLSVVNAKKEDYLTWGNWELRFNELGDWDDFLEYYQDSVVVDSTFAGAKIVEKYKDILFDPNKKLFMSATFVYVTSQDFATGCEIESDPVLVVKAAAPSKPAITDASYCIGATAAKLNATVTENHFLNWYGTAATGGTATTTAPVPATSKADTLSYYVSQTSSLTYCESPRTAVKVIVKPQPATPVLSRQGNQLNASVPNISWYRNDIKLADTTQKIKLDSNGVYTAMLTQNGCSGPLSAKMKYINAATLESVKAGNRVDTLSWSIKDTSSVRFIKIFRDTVSNPQKLLDSIDAKNKTYTDTTKLSLNVRYYYRVTLVDKDKFESDSSNILSATPRNSSPIPVKLASKDFSEVGEFNFIKTSFTAAGSKDLDGKIVKFEWYINDTLKSTTDTTYEYRFPQGTTTVKLVVYDNDGAKDSSTTKLRVTALSKQFSGGIFGGISALNRDIIYVTDTTNRPEYGSNVFKLNRLGKTQLQLSVGSKIFNTPSITADSSVLITNGINFNGFNKSGVPLWPTFPLGGITRVTPTIDSIHSKLYIGVSNRNFIAVDYKTGRPVWSYLSDAPVNTSAVITGNRRLVFTSESGTLYGFDIVKDTVQTNPKWKYTIGEVVSKSAAVDLSSNLYLGTNKGNLVKLRLNADSTVTKLWSTALTDSIDCSPVIDAKGFVYIGNNAGNMYKIDPANGNIIWTYKTGAAIKSTPAITEFGSIVFANVKGDIYSLDTLKNERWKHEAGSPISANILYIDNMVYAGTETGNLIGIFDNPKTSTTASVMNSSIYTPFEKVSNQVVVPEETYQKAQVAEVNEVPTSFPIWGTFQGNFRRTGSQVVECPSKPSILAQANAFSFCQGDSIKLEAPSVTDKFSWSSKSGSLKNLISNSITLNKAEDVYLVQTNIYGCSVTSDTVALKVKPLPNAPLISRDTSGNLVSSAGGTLTWYKDNVIISDTAQRFRPSVNGNYSLKIKVDGCSSPMSASYYYLTTSVTNLSNGEFVHLFPNPTTGEINVEYKLNSLNGVTATLIDMTGKIIFANKKILTGQRINLSGVPNGNYVLQFRETSGKLIATQKLIKF